MTASGDRWALGRIFDRELWKSAVTMMMDGESPGSAPDRIRLARAFDRVLATLGLIAAAFGLTALVHVTTGDDVVVFYLSAAVLATWAWGLGSGVLAVVAGSVLTMHGATDPVDEWQVTSAGAWIRLAILAVLATAFAVLVDELKSRNRELAATVNKLQTVIELTPVGIAIVDTPDPSSSPVYLNGTLASMLGTTKREVLLEAEAAKVFRSNGEVVPAYQLPLHLAIALGRTTGRRHLEVAEDGDRLELIAQAAPLVEHGVPSGAVAAYVDVTESRRREEQLVRASHAKDEFLGMVSHELKTPLTIISGNAEVLQRLWPDPRDEIHYALADITTASRQLLLNVENLITISRIGDGLLQLEPVALRPLIARVIDRHARLGAAIELRSPDVRALATPVAIERVLDNLLSNAEKYSPPNTPIELGVDIIDGEVDVVVADQGFGLNEGEAEAIFEPFYRSPRTSAATGGMGLGLSVCKQIVNSMGGRMWARNREAGGSEFGFSLLRGSQDDDDETQDP
jgi:K+-sensing histidine kinase KdpD